MLRCQHDARAKFLKILKLGNDWGHFDRLGACPENDHDLKRCHVCLLLVWIDLLIQVQNHYFAKLVRYVPSGIHYARLRVAGKLIRKTRLLDEVIYDLREALYRYPVEVSIWQALGDAYMRANRLQDALDAYTKAEELLR